MLHLGLTLLLACAPSAEDTLLLEACAALPGLDVDAAGRQLLREVLVEDELALYDAQPEPRPGLRLATWPGYGVIRANSRCEWRADDPYPVLVRWEPEFDPARFKVTEVQELPFVRREPAYTVERTPAGLRVRVGLAEALAEADAAWALAEAGDLAGAEAALTALHARFPDPLILFERHALRAP